MNFFEFLKITTIGPQHLRLNEDVLRLIHDFIHEPNVLLICEQCKCVLLTEENNQMFMHTKYFTHNDISKHICYNCSRNLNN